MKKELFACCVSMILIGQSFLSAQEQDTIQKRDTVKELNEVVISATRLERNLYETGRSISVITADDIAKSGAITIADVLANTEGIYVVGTGQNYGSQTSIFMRGASSNHCVIMIDGVRLSDPSSPANGVDLNEISLTNIERIEVVRGSHSTMYGSSAIGGIVNIITKQGGKPGFHVDAIGTFGMFTGNSDFDGNHEEGSITDYNINLGYTFKFGLYLKAGVLSTFSQGFNSTVDTVITPNTYKHADQGDGFEKLGRNIKLGYKDKKLSASFGYRSEIQGSAIDDGTFADDDNYTLGFRRELLNYDCKFKFTNNLSASVNGGYTNMYRIAEDDSSFVSPGVYDQTYIRNDYWGTNFTNDVLLNGKWKGLEVLAGLTNQNETMTGTTYIYSNSFFGVYEDSTDLDSLNLNTSTMNFFAHTDISGSLFSEKCTNWSLGLGGRYIDHSQFGTVMTYEITPGYKFSEKGMLYLSYSTGFNAPSMYQLYTPEKDPFSGIQRGNKNLRSEYSVSIELGLKRKVSDDLSWSASVFKTKVTDVIDYVYLWNGNTSPDSISFADYKGDTYINTGRSITSGIEFSLNSSFSEKLAVILSLSVVGGSYIMDESTLDTSATHGHHVQVFNNGAFIEGEVEIPGLARRTSSGSLTLIWKPIVKLRIAPSIRYVGNRTDLIYDFTLGPYGALTGTGLGDYMLIDLNLSYAFNNKFAVSLKGENLTNQSYQEIRGFASRGIGAYLKVSASF